MSLSIRLKGANLDSNNQKIGRLLVWSRTHIGISVEDVAVELGVPVAEVLKMERGEGRPQPEQLLVLAELFRVQPSWFFPAVHDFKTPPRWQPGRDQPMWSQRSGGNRIELMVEDLRILIDRDFDADTLQRLIGVLRGLDQSF